MSPGRDIDGRPLPGGDTYHSLETISEDSAPDTADGVLITPIPREARSAPGLPLTEAISRVGARIDAVEARLWWVEVGVAVVGGGVLAVVTLDLLSLALVGVWLGVGW